MIIAQYTIRSKQDYIFRTNRVLEIVGASENIANIWNVLFETATNIGFLVERVDEKNIDFQMSKVEENFENKKCNIVELFCGGGNETILLNNIEDFKDLNRAFSYRLISEYPGIIPMVVSVEVTGDYEEDYRNLMKESDGQKNIMEPQWDMFTVPFAMMDRSTFQPFSRVIHIDGKDIRKSDEGYNKYLVGQTLRNSHDDIRLFDEMVTMKGKESLLAVVHADGNNMGSKIMGMLHGEKNYDNAITLMRDFTITTADCFEREGDNALRRCFSSLEEKYQNQIKSRKLKKESLAYRRVIGSGDDVTFICNARFVMDYVEAYLDSVQNYHKNKGSKWRYSSCAGICIFHSHYPFSKAYSIAEQACDDYAKEKVHLINIDGSVVEQGWVDFHFIHSGIGGNLNEIRKTQGTDDCIARPWLISYDQNDYEAENMIFKYDKLIHLKNVIESKGVSRTAIKTIGAAFERNKAAAKKELTSIYGHTNGLEDEIKDIFKNEDDFLKAIYDLAEIYDLWYSEVK